MRALIPMLSSQGPFLQSILDAGWRSSCANTTMPNSKRRLKGKPHRFLLDFKVTGNECDTVSEYKIKEWVIEKVSTKMQHQSWQRIGWLRNQVKDRLEALHFYRSGLLSGGMKSIHSAVISKMNQRRPSLSSGPMLENEKILVLDCK